jgi:GT2 family glycosyltransferase
MVSAVVLSYNRCAEVLISVDKLKHYRESMPFEVEIVVVDNASVDDTSLQVKQYHPDVKLVRIENNVGIAGWNEGFKVAKHKYLLVLDDDSHIESGLAEAVDFMEANKKVGILAFQIKDLIEKPGDLDPEEAWKDNQDIPGFIGCGAMIRKELFEKIGGYGEWIYLYTHEFEYALRCLNAGYLVKFFSKGNVIHRTSGINRSNKRLRTFATRNELAIIYKFFGKERGKYLFRVLLNNLKFIRREGIKSGYYILLGAFKFLQMRKNLPHTPVSKTVQDFYASSFWSTQPVLGKVKKRIL